MKSTGKKKFVKTLILGLSLILATFAFGACGNAPGQKVAEDANAGAASEGVGTPNGKIIIAGSTSVQPLSDVLAEAFEDANPDVTVDVQGGGSGVGITSIEQGIADLGSLSREVKEGEKASVREEYVIAKDGIAVIVNKDVTVADLTMDQLKGIFTGEIKNWKEVGGADAPIVVVAREEGSGTRGAFNELTGVQAKDASGNEIDNTVKSAIVQPSTGAVAGAVAGAKNSIGYISLGSLDGSVKAVKVEGVEASDPTVIDGSYKLSRPFLYVRGAALSPQAQAYVDFVFSPAGREIVTGEGYVSAQ